jgi:hypothetical protein
MHKTHTNDAYKASAVDPTSSTQNAFVQSWLEAYRKQYGGREVFLESESTNMDTFDLTIEAVQETYSYLEDDNAK